MNPLGNAMQALHNTCVTVNAGNHRIAIALRVIT